MTRSSDVKWRQVTRHVTCAGPHHTRLTHYSSDQVIYLDRKRERGCLRRAREARMRYMEKTPLTSLSSLEVAGGLILGHVVQVATSLSCAHIARARSSAGGVS